MYTLSKYDDYTVPRERYLLHRSSRRSNILFFQMKNYLKIRPFIGYASTRWSCGDRIGLPCLGYLVRYPQRSVSLSTVVLIKDLRCRREGKPGVMLEFQTLTLRHYPGSSFRLVMWLWHLTTVLEIPWSYNIAVIFSLVLTKDFSYCL